MKEELPKAMRAIQTPLGKCKIYFGAGILSKIGALDCIRSTRAAGIVFDSNTKRLFARKIKLSKNTRACDFAFPAGETNKNLETAGRILEFFASSGLDRSSVVVAVGGGVTTDLGGFVASVFMRGISWIAVPTTLLGMVDAAIGGKTGVDLTSGKNLAGTFHPPRAVVIDPDALQTLGRRDRAGGIAEMIKIALACDAKLYNKLYKSRGEWLTCNPRKLEPLIRAAIHAKARLVELDERDTGARLALNLGHTTGHALEAATNYKYFHHGEAVAIGLRVAMDLASALGMLAPATRERTIQLLRDCGLPIAIPRKLTNARILAAMRFDKKSSGGRIRFILPVDGHATRAEFIDKTGIVLALDAARER
ncbi:MAG: 3-dehydroquinate synthase [Planctomycetes bacterium]|nr:3-dehydroquinate synthase [Planctomycetota bacterium]